MKKTLFTVFFSVSFSLFIVSVFLLYFTTTIHTQSFNEIAFQSEEQFEFSSCQNEIVPNKFNDFMPFDSSTNIDEININDIHYNSDLNSVLADSFYTIGLNEAQLELYYKMPHYLSSVGDYLVPIENDLSLEEARAVAVRYYAATPSLYWLGSAKTYYYSNSMKAAYIKFNHYDVNKNLFRDKVNAVVNHASELPDDYSKSKYIFEYLCNTLKYDYAALSDKERLSYDQSAYSAIAGDGLTVCSGYAKAFQLLCEESGVNVISVLGDNHLYNYVRIDNWYLTDVTWSDGNNNSFDYSYFLIGEDTLKSIDSSIYHYPLDDYDHVNMVYPTLSKYDYVYVPKQPSEETITNYFC